MFPCDQPEHPTDPAYLKAESVAITIQGDSGTFTINDIEVQFAVSKMMDGHLPSYLVCFRRPNGPEIITTGRRRLDCLTRAVMQL